MRRVSVPRLAMIAAGTVLALGAATPSAIAAPARRPDATPGWRLVKEFGPCATGAVNAVTSTGPKGAWATGAYGYCAGAGLLVGRWDGRTWQALRAPKGFGGATGTAVAALSSSYSWTFVNTFALLRDGARWRTFRLADRSDITSAAVFSRSNAWAFGSIPGGQTTAYAVRFNGRTWRRVAVPVAVQAASSAGPASIWAVGLLAKGGFALAHWTGRWKTTRLPDLHLPSGQSISDAWVVPDHSGGAWITVSAGDEWTGASTGVLLHWTGRKWATIMLPVQVAAVGPLAPDGHGGLWVTSYPTSLQCTNSLCDDVEMLHYIKGTTWAGTVVPVEGLIVNSMRLIPGTTSLWAGGIICPDENTDTDGVMIKYGR